MASLLVLVAHSGRTLQLDVQPSTRVDAVQHALVSFTGIPVSDQIAMYQGARLDPNKFLGAYRLPVDPAVASVEDHPVFLYCRSYLKPGAALPPPEALPPLHVQVPPRAEVNLAHPLQSAPSPLVRALPDYERHFQHHLATTRAYWDVAQARLQRCRQLLSEQEVQARAADAARANVEAHYSYILNSYQTFLDKYNAQHAAHALLLSTFPADLAALEAIELHPSLQQPPPQQPQSEPREQHQPQPLPQPQPQPQQLLGQAAPAAAGPGAASAASPTTGVAGFPWRLADLYPVTRLREWAETCARSHSSFGSKVAELEALFQLLRRDVEGLFMQAPSVDLDALGRQMAEHEALLDEHSSMVQVLSKDLRTVRTLVEDVVRQLGSAAGTSGAGGGMGGASGTGGMRPAALHDSAAAMEAIHETHRNRVLPRLAQLDGQLASFAASVEASKVAMSRDVLAQLQRISGQQSRIRDMKNKLAAFHEVLARQDVVFAELRVVHRLPSAYRAVLAEVVRRGAWHQLYCGQAGRLAEHMARLREKEAGRRAAFAAQVARYIPADLLARAGLASEPPHCQVTVPVSTVPLISVSMADLQRLSYLDGRVSAASSTAMRASASRSVHPHPQLQHHKYPQAAAAAASSGAAPEPGTPHTAVGPPGSPHVHHHTHHHQQHLHSPHAQQQQSQPRHHQQQQQTAGAGRGPAGAASLPLPFPGTVAVLDADPAPPLDDASALEMENARLRAELADHIAAACIRELTAAAAVGDSAQQPQPSQQQRTSQTQQQQQQQSEAATSQQQQQQQHVIRTSGGGAGPSVATSVVGSPPPAAGGAAAAGVVQPPAAARRDPAELVMAMQRALAMKDDLIRQQQREAATLAARVATYEERITALEALLTSRAVAEGGAGASAATALPRSSSSSGGERDQAERSRDEERMPAALEETGRRGSETLGEEGGCGAMRCAGSSSGGPEGGAREAELAKPEAAGPVAVAVGGELASAAAAAAAARGAEAAGQREVGAEAGGQGAPTSAAGAVQDGGEGDGAAQPASLEASAEAPASPFSLQAAQEQATQSGGRQPGNGGVGGCAAAFPVVQAGQGAEDAAGAPLEAAAAAIPLALVAPLRGSSGPQAIPQVAGGLRRGGGGGGHDSGREGAEDGAVGLPYEARVPPMSIGSLPFATSLPVGSSMAGRLASSPSAGIGLGLALGFGLTSLAEGSHQRQRSGSPHDGRHSSGNGGSSSSAHSARSSVGGGSGGGRDGDGYDRGGAWEEAEEETGGGSSGAPTAAVEGSRTSSRGAGSVNVSSRGDGGGGSSSGGGSSLQFQPSWSAPVSGDLAADADGGADTDAQDTLGPASVAAAHMTLYDTGDGDGTLAVEAADDVMSASGGAEEGGSGCEGGESAAEVSGAVSTGDDGLAPGSREGSRGDDYDDDDDDDDDDGARDGVEDDGISDTEQCREEQDGEEEEAGYNGGEDEEGADDLPDIDEVIDSDGAWELTSVTMAAEAGAGVGPTGHGAGGGAEERDGGGAACFKLIGCADHEKGAGSGGVPHGGLGENEGTKSAEQGHLFQREAQQQRQLLDSSSGYESVGSLLSGGGEGV